MKKKAEKPTHTYKDAITYECPVRGTITQIVEVKVYPAVSTPDSIQVAEEVKELLEVYEEIDIDDL